MITLIILLILSFVTFYFAYRVINRPLGGVFYRYTCLFATNDIPCISQQDCNSEINHQFCNETISKCQPYITTNNRDDCLDAIEIFENSYD